MYSEVFRYVPEYDQNNQVWYSGIPEDTLPGIPGCLPEYDRNRFGARVPQSTYSDIPWYVREYDQNNQVRYPGTLGEYHQNNHV